MHDQIVGLSVVKNEADIIETMVRHNLGYLDALHVIDNDSADETPAILASLAAEFTGRVTWASDPRTGHRQTEMINTALAPLAAATDARQIVLLDGDEFLRGDIALFREVAGSSTPLLLPWTTYVPTESDDQTILNPVRRITHRRTQELPQFFKITVPGSMIGKVKVKPGNHKLRGEGAKAARTVAGLSLAHFPIRSRQQLTSKILIGTWNLRLRGKLRPGEALHWLTLFDRIMANGSVTDTDMRLAATQYAATSDSPLVHDPLPYAGTCDPSYSVKMDDNLIRNLAVFAEDCVKLLERQMQSPPMQP